MCIDRLSVCLLLLSLSLSLGCVTRQAEWSMALKNVGKDEIEDSTLKCGRFYYRPGILSSRTDAEFYCGHESIPENATIRWYRKGGEWRERQVNVKGAIPVGFKGCIYVQIDDSDQVVVSPKVRP